MTIDEYGYVVVGPQNQLVTSYRIKRGAQVYATVGTARSACSNLIKNHGYKVVKVSLELEEVLED